MTTKPYNYQKLLLAQPVLVGDTTIQTQGKFTLTSTDSGIVNRQMICVSPGKPNVEGMTINQTVEPTIIEDRTSAGLVNIYEYMIEARGLHSDNDTLPATKFSATREQAHAYGEEVVIPISLEYFNIIMTDIADAVAAVEDESNNVALMLGQKLRSTEQRLINDQAAFEVDMQGQQDLFEIDIQDQQDDYEDEVDLKIASFDARQSLLTAVVDSLDDTQLNISGGNWLDGTIPRTFVGVNVNPTLSQTTYYSLQAGSGTLVTSAGGFLSGNFPVCVVVTDISKITTVTNYGAYVIPTAIEGFGLVTDFVYDSSGYLVNFTDSDSVVWTLTYNTAGQVLTMTDGIDITTFSYNGNGEFIGVTYS